MIQDLILLFFRTTIDTNILTDDEIDIFLDLLKSNDKFIGTEWKLIYRKSMHKRFHDEAFVRKQYENKENIICLIKSENNNVMGGYSSTGWSSKHNTYNRDEKAYIFGIRLSNGYDPCISNIKPVSAAHAVRSYNGYYLIFGTPAIYIELPSGLLSHSNPKCYESLPTKKRHLLGGETAQEIMDLEIFQII